MRMALFLGNGAKAFRANVGTDSDDAGDTIIVVRVPYAEVITYTKDLRSLSRGSGSYTLN